MRSGMSSSRICPCGRSSAALGKTILYSLNPADNGVIDTIMGSFNGMLTDSRSFLSYTRHEYFRRILCNLFSQMVEDGEYPADMEYLGQMVEDISYNNTLRYFRFDEIIK